jgi:Uma2 family endonuclease
MTQQQSKHQAKVKLTVADYMNMPDDVRYQLIDGELILAPSPTNRHQAVTLELAVALRQFVRRNSLGIVRIAPLDVILAEHEVFQPDILFVSNDRRALFVSNDRREIMTPANIQGAPDLVVEILSPSTRRNDRGHKLGVYSRCGVREYWIVDPDAGLVEVLSAGDSGLALAATFSFEDVLVSPLLPGLAVELDQVLAEV